MKKLVLMVLALGLFSSLALANVTLTVKAYDHSLAKTPLNTGIMLKNGDHLVITTPVDDLWSAGANDRTSNADGLGLNNAYGSNYGLWSQYGASFYYGTLVGQISDGSFFRVGTRYDGYAANDGELKLMYWDSNYGDNSGEVTSTLGVNVAVNPAVPAPGAIMLGSLGMGLVGWLRRRTH